MLSIVLLRYTVVFFTMRDAKDGVNCFSAVKIYDILSVIKPHTSRQTLNLTYLQILLVCQFTFKARGSFILRVSYLVLIFVKHQPVSQHTHIHAACVA